VAGIHQALEDSVPGPTLLRSLTPEEVDKVSFIGGFTPAQVYDCFLEKIGDNFECGFCGEDNRANWKHKDDPVRHFRKFHFGLDENCTKWWGPGSALGPSHPTHARYLFDSEKPFYSPTEKKKYVC
jgi:hypothetical protein